MGKFLVTSLFIVVLVLSGCSVDGPSVGGPSDPCFQTSIVEGDCEKLIQGYEYTRVGSCVEVRASGCRGSTPFDTLEACRLACEREYTAESWKGIIPLSCESFSDGCNTCSRSGQDGAVACTKMACVTYLRPRCLD